MKGAGKMAPHLGLREGVLPEILWAWIGATLGIGACAYLSHHFFEPYSASLLIGSFGASAVLVYGVIKSPLAQPRNLVGGHIISAVVGVVCYKLFGPGWVAPAMAVSLAIVAMIVTSTVHPPGGASALIAVIGADQIHNLGFLYPFVPVGLGVLVLLIVALLVNNLPRHRQYPEYWY
jgi:CBS-domain-containing membrane protein